MAERTFIKNCLSETWKQCYCDLRLGNKATETPGMAASNEYVATPWDVGGGGVLGVIRLGEVGRNPNVIKIKGHKAAIQDANFSPFYNSILATASEDLTIRVWDIPDEPPAGMELKSPVANLQGSPKKVTHCEWNRAADFILASCSFDGTIRLWNVESQAEVTTIKSEDHLLALKWNATGNLLACTNKNKALQILDPRGGKIVQSVMCHEGAKSAKCIWMDGTYGGGDNCVLTTGFSKQQERELKVFDIRKISEHKAFLGIDRSSQPLYPFFDESLGVLFVAGKGDGNCRYYQYHGDELKRIDEYRSTIPIKSMCFIPKASMNFMRCEISRMLKNENGKTIVPISFLVPRKNTEVFQKDLYPPIPVADAAVSADQWLAGKDGVIETYSPEPGVVGVTSNKKSGAKAYKKSRSIVNSSPAVLAKQAKVMANENEKLQSELDSAQSKIEELKQKEAATSSALAASRHGGNLDSGQLLPPSNLNKHRASVSNSTADDAIYGARAQESAAVASSKLSAAERKIQEMEKRVEDLQKKYEIAEKEKYDKTEKVADLDAKLKAKDRQVEQLQERLKQLETNLAKGGGALERVSTLRELDDNLRAEITEMRDFLREVISPSVPEN